VLLSGDPGRQYDGALAIGASFAVSGIAIGILLVAVALMAWRWPEVRTLLHPLHLMIIIAQVLDGATTWVGVMNPFQLNLPHYEEQVLLSRLILDHFGGLVYFLIKVILGVLIVAALEFAFQHTRTKSEFLFTRLVQLALIIVSFIPVGNNLANFLAIV
jgi:hypothetical protein